MKKLTQEQADILLHEYCNILERKAQKYGDKIIFEAIEEREDYRIVRGEFSTEEYLLEYELYCRYNERYIHYKVSNIYGINFSKKDILETRKIMLDFVNEISARKYTDKQLQDFMSDDSNVTIDNEIGLIKEKTFDFYGYEMFFYQKQYDSISGDYETLSICGKTENFR